jgi:hypothetical protein
MKEDSCQRLAFKTSLGHFEPVVMPFGTCNAPAALQTMMNRIFRQYTAFVETYMDDFLVHSKTREEHLQHLRKIFEVLRAEKLFLKREKCTFAALEAKFFGMIFSADGMSIDKERIQAIQEFPAPRSVRDVQSFLGTTGWLRQFVSKYAEISAVLTDLTVKVNKKRKFTELWSAEAKRAFEALKSALVRAPALRNFNPNYPICVYSDASEFAGGGYLAQQYNGVWHPILYWSRKWRDAEVSYGIYEKELMAAHNIITRVGRPYLLGRPVHLFIDQRALKYLMSQTQVRARQAKWILDLQEFDLIVEYIPGETNKLADLLSRNLLFAPRCVDCKKVVEDEQLLLVQTFDLDDFDRNIREALKSDVWANTNVRKVGGKKVSEKDGLLYYEDRLYIPKQEKLRTKLMELYHDPVQFGHNGARRMIEK